MDEIREFDGILDEEDRDVIPNKIIIPFFCIELRGESTGIPHGFSRSLRSCHRGKAHEYRRLHRRILKEFRHCIVFHRFIHFELTVCGIAPGMDDALRDPLVVKVCHLFTEVEIFDQGRTAFPRLEGKFIFRYLQALIRGEMLILIIHTVLFQLFILAIPVHLAMTIITHSLNPLHLFCNAVYYVNKSTYKLPFYW